MDPRILEDQVAPEFSPVLGLGDLTDAYRQDPVSPKDLPASTVAASDPERQ